MQTLTGQILNPGVSSKGVKDLLFFLLFSPVEFACAGEEREVLADGSTRGWSNLCRHRSILLRYLAPFRAATAGT